MLRCAIVNRGGGRSPSTGRQIGPRGNDRQITSHHVRAAQLLMSSRHRCRVTDSELSRSHRRHSPADVRIVDVRHIREPRASVQRRDSAQTVQSAKSIKAHDPEPSPISAPPREEAVTRPDGQPAEASPSSPSKTETKTPPPAESEERDVGRGPEGTVKSRTPNRSRPPRPRAAVRHPAPVVIRGPAPWLVANPGPAVVRLVKPVAITNQRPILGLIRHPYLTVIRGILPAAIRVQVFRSHVILVRVMPGIRIVNHAVAVAVPPVPIIPLGGGGNLVARLSA